jgi:beta-lactamase regulating signal transducer with metallopeptidase domain
MKKALKSSSWNTKKVAQVLTLIGVVLSIIFTCVRIYSVLNAPAQSEAQSKAADTPTNQRLTYSISLSREVVASEKKPE